MILGAEIAITLLGLYLLITGRTFGKQSFTHGQLRLLGGFLLTLFPVILVVGVGAGILWGLRNPDADPQAATEQLRWPLAGIEFGLVIVYAVIGTWWEKSLRRSAAAGRADV